MLFFYWYGLSYFSYVAPAVDIYVYMFNCLKEGRYQYNGYMLCYASDTIEYDRRTPELSNAALHMKQDTTSIEKKTDRPLSLRLRHRLTSKAFLPFLLEFSLVLLTATALLPPLPDDVEIEGT